MAVNFPEAGHGKHPERNHDVEIPLIRQTVRSQWHLERASPPKLFGPLAWPPGLGLSVADAGTCFLLLCVPWAHENGKWLKLGDSGRAECPWARLTNVDETPWEWLSPQELQIGLRGVWPQLVVPATAGGNLCFDSMAELIRGRSCLQTLLWTLDCCFVPKQQFLQRRLFQSALAGKNSICLRAVGEVLLSVPLSLPAGKA